MRNIINLVIPKKTNKKRLIEETNHVLDKIAKYGLDKVLKENKEKPQ